MEEKVLIVLDEGVKLAEVAAMPVCCKTSQGKFQTAAEYEQ
jgi:hypothetical protein